MTSSRKTVIDWSESKLYEKLKLCMAQGVTADDEIWN
jgi:hypothetical protein